MSGTPLALAAPAVAPRAPLVTTAERSAGRLADPADLREGCPNWRRGLRIQDAFGNRWPVRCKSPNRCAYCGTMTAIENAEVLKLDAETGARHPNAILTLTTLRPVTSGELRQATASFMRAFRRRWGAVEYCGFVEWTTGNSERSGGKRRIHLHVLLKGLSVGEGCYVSTRRPRERRPCVCEAPSRCVECWTRAEWRKLVGAWVVEARELLVAGGATAYLSLHHRKREQGPPPGWSGKRFRPSKGYFNRPVAELREEARLRLAERAAERRGDDPSAVRARKALDVFSGRVVPHGEEDGRVAEQPGHGYSERELNELVALATAGRVDEPEPDRLARLIEGYQRLDARDRIDARRPDPPEGWFWDEVAKIR